MTEEEKDLRTKISEILVRWNMPTRQAAISALLSLIAEEVQGIIGEDENLTVVGRKYFTNTGEMEEMIGDGEEEWKIPRNQLRAEQRKLAKEKGILNCPCHCHKGYCLDCNNICYICYKNGKNGKHLGLKAGEEDED